MIMIRNKGFQLLALAFVLTMLFSVSVLAGEVETQGAEGVAQSTVENVTQAGGMEMYSYYPVHERTFEEEFVKYEMDITGEWVPVKIPVRLEIEYSY